MRVLNETGFRCGWFIGRVPPHSLSATLLVKGTFSLVHGGPGTAVREDEQELLTGDKHRGDDPTRALVYGSDCALVKPGTDVTLSGTCHAPGGKPTTVCPVTLRVGGWSKTLAVIGDRSWTRKLLMTVMTDPAPFTTM